MKMMKKNFILLFSVVLLAFVSCSFTKTANETSDKDKLLLELISYVLEKLHFEPTALDDTFSERVYDNFISGLDPMKRYFLATDIKSFEAYKTQIDDQIKGVDISFFNLVQERLVYRIDEAKDLYKKVLETPYNFTATDSLVVDYDSLEYAESSMALRNRWRDQLKYATLSTFYAKKENETLKKKEDAAFELSSDESLEIAARAQTKETLEEYFDYVDDLERKDWFVQYLNSIVETYDPHTFYFAPEEKERFDMDMSGKFEGIGARLQKRKDQTKIVEVISGGPVWRDQQIEVGDEILKVGQAGEMPIDIVGMPLDDAIKLIKGPKGSVVDLIVRKVDGSIGTISITRDIVKIEETFAKSATVNKGDYKYGLINLPKFYVDFDDYNSRNAATDIAAEIEKLKAEGAEGLILDLRDNGGGSLKTVVDIAGLFIKKGPVVQVKSSQEKIEVYEDTDNQLLWDGPLVILVNELSASASEILAAAMQDYKRAVVIGSKQTFGKGTVQNLIPLNNIVRSSEFGDLGAIKLTTQKFYRINGGSTQLKGVTSDVVVPDKYSYLDIGERDMDHPMAWDKIPAASYQAWEGYIDFESTIYNSKMRMAENEQITLIDENAKWLKEQQKNNKVSLSYLDFALEVEKDKERATYFKNIAKYDSKLTFKSLDNEQSLLSKDTDLREKRDRWHRELAKDVYVEEAVNVLQDLKLKFTKPLLAGIKG
ncbi:MAG: carboxyl-terminal processing protease [Arcticibacterium sp.]|jgi:carboxyl-terminal processing protease